MAKPTPSPAEVERARDWLARREKHPIPAGTKRSLWRWVLPDPPDGDGMADLPPCVFSRLRDQISHRFVFTTRSAALESAAVAVAQASAAGELDLC